MVSFTIMLATHPTSFDDDKARLFTHFVGGLRINPGQCECLHGGVDVGLCPSFAESSSHEMERRAPELMGQTHRTEGQP